MFQRQIRGKHKHKSKAVIKLQCAGRQSIAKRKSQALHAAYMIKLNSKATILQRYARGWISRKTRLNFMKRKMEINKMKQDNEYYRLQHKMKMQALKLNWLNIEETDSKQRFDKLCRQYHFLRSTKAIDGCLKYRRAYGKPIESFLKVSK